MIEPANIDIEPKLRSLRFLLIGTSGAFLDTFDQFMEQREFGLALHVVCDFLLEADTPLFDEFVLTRIQQLHNAMDIHDECTRDLVLRKQPPSNPS